MLWLEEDTIQIVGAPVSFRWWGQGKGIYLVYALRDRLANEIFYIGRTRHLKKRMRFHIRYSLMEVSRKNKLHNFMGDIVKNGPGFICDILGRFTTEESSDQYESKAMCLVGYFHLGKLKNTVIIEA